MGESSSNILILSESALNSLKNSDLVQKILDLKRKVVVDADLHELCEKIDKLTESMNGVVAENKKLQSDLAIVKYINPELEEKIVYLEKKQEKGDQYSHRNNVEVSGIPKSIPEDDFKNTVVSIHK